MVRNKDQDRARYIEKTFSYRLTVEKMLKAEQDARAAIAAGGEDAAAMRFELADSILNLVSNYLAMNGISQYIQHQRDEDALNDARKAMYKSIICLEETVSSYIDAPFSDYEEKLACIEAISPERRFLLIRKMGLAVELLEKSYGDNSKWKWTFVEMEGRFAAVSKNLINLKDAVANSDPRSEHYEATVLHLRLVRKQLMQAADRYRERYELSTNHIDDFQMGINFLSALKRLNTVTGAQDEIPNLQKKLDVWSNKLTLDKNKIHASKKG